MHPQFPHALGEPHHGSARIPWPRTPHVPPRQPIPLVAVLAPVALSMGVWAVTQSPMSLIFAALGPAIALGSVADGWRARRRTRRLESVRFASELARARCAIEAAHREELETLHSLLESPLRLLTTPIPPSRVWNSSTETEAVAVIGQASRPSGIRIPEGIGTTTTERVDSVTAGGERALAELAERAAILEGAPIAIDAHRGIAVIGTRALADAFARLLVMQLSSTLTPERYQIEGTAGLGREWGWLTVLPHWSPARSHRDAASVRSVRFIDGSAGVAAGARGSWGGVHTDIVVTTAPGESSLEHSHAHTIEARSAAEFVLTTTGSRPRAFRPLFATLEHAHEWATEARRLASLRGLRGPTGGYPAAAQLGGMLSTVGDRAGLSARFCTASAGPIDIDLVDAGPHAVVAGVTGSGKSELLTSWVLAMANGRSPTDVNFLMVDFKGGAHLDQLAALPHTVGVITDLDRGSAARALASLRAEVERRESVLRSLGAHSIDDDRAAGAMARLVVVVDEFAVVADQLPELHSVFVDVAARGRSLGIHLLLCTQRVAGVVRDSVLSNCPLRLCLRVTNQADSVAMVGSSASAELPAGEKGLVLVARSGETAVLARVARAVRDDIDAVVARAAAGAPVRRPWCEPLPERIALSELLGRTAIDHGDAESAGGHDGGVAFAVADRPERQAQPTVRLTIVGDLPLLVLGAARSGRSSTLDTLCAALEAGPEPVELRRAGSRGAEVWDLIENLLAAAGERELRRAGASTIIGVIDNLDTAVLDLPSEYQAAVIERLDLLIRGSRASGVSVIVAAAALNHGLQSLATHFANPIVLRMPTRLDHSAAGEAAETFDASAPPGRARWHGTLMQIALVSRGETAAISSPAPRVRSVAEVAVNAITLAVSSRPGALAATLRDTLGHRARVVDLTASEPLVASGMVNDITITDGSTVVYVADPETWQVHWAALTRLRHSSAVLFDGCTVADFRAITRSRELPPPFPNSQRAVWLREPDGTTARMTLA